MQVSGNKKVHPLRLGSSKQSLKQSSSVCSNIVGFLPASTPVASTHQPVSITQLPGSVFKIQTFSELKIYVQSYMLSIRRFTISFYLTLRYLTIFSSVISSLIFCNARWVQTTSITFTIFSKIEAFAFEVLCAFLFAWSNIAFLGTRNFLQVFTLSIFTDVQHFWFNEHIK